MFQAGVVAPSSARLLQLLTLLADDIGKSPFADADVLESENLEELPRPPTARDATFEVFELASLPLLVSLARPYFPLLAENPPVLCGLMGPILLLPPIAVGNVLGCRALARLLKAPIHCRTWAGSLPS